ncbi:translation initiation factor if-3 [Dorcoceras hygrometricum]|nr:translation initiation factor if-3 [Dorcoceras hygrometricum]
MAGLTSSFAPLLKPQLPQSHQALFLQWCTRNFSLHTATWPSIPVSKSAVSARYGGGVSSRRSKTNDDEALNISSIGSSTVRLIDEQQKMVGLVSKAQALQMADDAELDLVILSSDADPPVVRIMDYNKYRYEQQKKKREQQKKSAAGRMDLKELKMGYNIDVHDYSVRLKAAHKFLKDGDKVKVIVSLKGRENEFRNNAIELIKRFQNDVGELAMEESKNFRERNIFIILVPNKAVAQKSQEPPKKKNDTAANEVSAGVESI